MTMYIRLKRKNQTMFLHVEPSDNFLQIKQRVAENFGMEPSAILLFAQDKRKELLDLATVSDQEVKNDDVVYMTFAKETGSGYEEIQVDTLVSFGDDGDTGSH